MGILTELFVATDEEAKSYGGLSAHDFKSAQFGNLTSLEFETLWAILDRKDWNPDSYALVAVHPPDETWTFKFPSAYVRRLQELDRDEIVVAAKQWAATEELACAPADVELVINKLVSLAQLIDNDNRNLFLWGSV